MAIVSAKVKIKGKRPLMFHTFSPDSIPLEKKEKTGVAGNDPEEWKKSFTSTANGQLYVDPSYIFGCLREGAKHTKKGKGSIQSLVAATLQVDDDRVLMNRFVPKDLKEVTTDPEQPVYLDIRSVKNPSTKARNVRYRLAMCTGWETEFTITWDNTIVSRTQMEAVCIDAGNLVGLADGRSIGFGRFEVLNFEVIEDADKKTA